MARPTGNIFAFGLVERWIIDIVEKWVPDYLAEAERQADKGVHFFAPIASYITANEWEAWPEEHLPSLLVMDTGLGQQPTRYGSGTWTARRLYSVSIICQAPSRSDVRFNATVYMAAIRSLLLQHQDLDHPEHITGLDWTDERPAPIPTPDERNIAAQIGLFLVDVKDIADEGGVPRGPQFPNTPSPNPYDDPPADLPIIVEDVGGTHDPAIPAPGESTVTIRTRKVGS